MTKNETLNIDLPVKKKSKGKKALKIIGSILTVIVILVAAAAAVSALGNNKNYELARSFSPVEYENRLVPQKDADGDWCFTTDKDLKVVQITDVHIGGGFMSITKDKNALKEIAAMLTAEKPDLVIVTGDVAYPVPFQAGTFNNKVGARMFAQLMDALGVYWTLGFGNHDTEAYSYFDRGDISDFYLNGGFRYCLYQPGPEDIDGFGNQVLKVKNSAGRVTQALFVFDSHSYTDGDYFGIQWKYDNIHENQVEWYKQQVEKLKEENGGEIVKSLAFFHIPLVEFKDAWDEFAANGYKDTENVKYVSGIVGETGKAIYCGIGEDDLFETMLELGSTKAVFCGHDHFNNFTVNYMGIDLSYGYSVDNLAYIGVNKKGSQRGCTVIDISPDGSYEINKYNLYLSGRYEGDIVSTDDIAMQFDSVTYQYFEE